MGAPTPCQLPPGQQLSGGELLAWRQAQLQLGGAQADFDWLLDLAGGLGWQQLQALRLRPERLVTLCRTLDDLSALWRRHLRSQEPLQYLVGRCVWRDLELQVGPGVLIPRQETECLLELALQQPLAPAAPPGWAWADLGTGSGCLAAALARALPRWPGVAVDLSHQALHRAAANLAAAGVADRVTLLHGSWWQPLQPWWGRLALVVANPPYIPTAVWEQLDPRVRLHEPPLALDGGADGLGPLRAIAAGAARALAPGGLLLLEHHHDQREPALALLERAGLSDARAFRDLEGQWRFVSARRPA